MSITVRELMQLPHLQISLVVGEAGIDREVSWVHTSDLPNPVGVARLGRAAAH